jgi:hypothetical protein
VGRASLKGGKESSGGRSGVWGSAAGAPKGHLAAECERKKEKEKERQGKSPSPLSHHLEPRPVVGVGEIEAVCVGEPEQVRVVAEVEKGPLGLA